MFHRQLLERVETHPGVVSAAVSFTFPLSETGPMVYDFQIEGRDVIEGESAPRFDFRSVSPDYFRTIGLPLVRGRLFTDADREATQPVVIVNRHVDVFEEHGLSFVTTTVLTTVPPGRVRTQRDASPPGRRHRPCAAGR